jgi:ABC-type Mn2+/Zn2+ transport system ATPase subunit
METSALITLREAAFGYGGEPVIENVSLTVKKGEFIGLIGPNGAGKSTLFKGILKLLPPLSGSVTHAPELRRRVGYVPQRDTLDPIYPLTAWDVVRMGFLGPHPWYRLPNKKDGPLIRQRLEQVKMEDFSDHPFALLSGGQRQRVLIARALAVRPELLVLDEPTAGIDPVAEENILTLLGELHEKSQISILMVSHHIQSLRKRVQRVIVVNRGGVLDGLAAEMLAPERMLKLLEAGV